ncbi:MAG: hypothetical protein WCZ28_06045 [Burkholderiaceae bacterium]
MSFELHAGRRHRPWRDFLTSDEREQLARIDREIGEIDARRRDLSRDRRLITNRATQRAAYHKGVPA